MRRVSPGCAERGEVNVAGLCFAVMNGGELEPGVVPAAGEGHAL